MKTLEIKPLTCYNAKGFKTIKHVYGNQLVPGRRLSGD